MVAVSDTLPEYQDARILVIEDETLISSLISEILVQFKIAVAGIAASGPEAIALAEQTLPTLALVDIHVGGLMDGVEIAHLLRERFGTRTIFLSGTIDPATLQRAQAAAPVSFVEKPFRPSQVLDAIHKALSP